MAGKDQLCSDGREKMEGERSLDALSEDRVTEMIGSLKLTAEESDALEIADDVEEGLATSSCAIIGKVLSQGILHIQTIMSALRPAWGNPKGLNATSVGDNLFIAEFSSIQDKDRVLDGSPWTVGNRAVLVQDFDANLRPTDINLNHLSIWVRILNLPFGLMNKIWGEELAGMLGVFEKVDVDDKGKAWGPYLRVRVKIDITKPLRRGVSIFSKKRQAKEWYEVRYEKLPSYCYSCGRIGHSSVECPSPAERDENGMLPYSVDLRALDEKKKKVFDESRGQSARSKVKNHSESSSKSMSENATCRHSDFKEKNTCPAGQQNMSSKNENNYASEDGRGDGQHMIIRMEPKILKGDRILLVGNQDSPMLNQGKKRKKGLKSQDEACSTLAIENTGGVESMELAITVAHPTETFDLDHFDGDGLIEEEKNEMSKKQKKGQAATLSVSAVAGSQPRRQP